VFHVGNELLEFFNDALKPWVHYVPIFEKDLNDVKNLIEFVLENDQVARQIAKRGRDFIMEHLKMDDIYCYWEELIKEYTKLLKYKPKLEKNFKRIK
jgi:EGF-domain serine glucosyl/xylosyltransferase